MTWMDDGQMEHMRRTDGTLKNDMQQPPKPKLMREIIVKIQVRYSKQCLIPLFYSTIFQHTNRLQKCCTSSPTDFKFDDEEGLCTITATADNLALFTLGNRIESVRDYNDRHFGGQKAKVSNATLLVSYQRPSYQKLLDCSSDGSGNVGPSFYRCFELASLTFSKRKTITSRRRGSTIFQSPRLSVC